MKPDPNPLAARLAAQIEREGPILFSAFMEAALYDPQHGYYSAARRAADEPTGIHGDYFTAAQLQPVFGRLIRSAALALRGELALPAHCALVDWGAGRALMAEAFPDFEYIPVEVHGPRPGPLEGIVLANELFDALPVDVVRGGRRGPRLLRVGWRDGRFAWVEGEEPPGEWKEYALAMAQPFADLDEWEIELPVRMEGALEEIGACLRRGALLVIDYGYAGREILRFPRGTLMSYRRHRAAGDVLADPGNRDITAHVPFTTLAAWAGRKGWKAAAPESLASFLLRAGERDRFASALEARSGEEAQRLRLQLKTLLFGMGETFRCLRLDKEG